MNSRGFRNGIFLAALLASAGVSSQEPPGVSRSLSDALEGVTSATFGGPAQLDAQLPKAQGLKGSWPLRLKLAQLQKTTGFGFQPRIVNGVDAGVRDARWQVGLIAAGFPAAGGQFCGGSVIAAQWILTAAHCVENTAPQAIRIFSGSIDLNSPEPLAEVQDIKVHERWNAATMENDIALLKLAAPLALRPDKVTAVQVAANSPVPGDLVYVTGWGATSEGGAGSIRLQKVVVPVVRLAQCNARDFYNGAILAGMVCAGVGGKDSCQGDSGGPLTDAVAGASPIQFGVVSWGIGCARPNKPGVYTDVAHFADWIRTAMK
jgi:transmembrane serine protease 9